MGTHRSWLIDLAALTLLLTLFFGFQIGERALWAPVEGRYAEIARSMAASGDYVTPRLNGVKYLKKPPLFFWLEAFTVRLLGETEAAFRAWEVIFGVLGCLAVYIAGRRLYGRRAGIIAAALLATTPLYYAGTRIVSPDLPLTFFLTAALLSALWATQLPDGSPRAVAIIAFYAFSSLATLTKGLMGIVVPAMIVGLWIIWTRERRFIKALLVSWGPALFVTITAPWHVLVSHANPEFWQIYFFKEHIQRYLTMDEGLHNQPWVFLPVLLLGGFPWTAFLVQAILYHSKGARNDKRRETLLLVLWPGLLFLFFSFSSSKVIPYVLPVFPALAILTGAYLSAAWERADLPGMRSGVWLLILGVCFLLFFGLGVPQYYVERYANWPSLEPPELDTTMSASDGGTPTDVPGLKPYIFVQMAIMAVAALSAVILVRRRKVGEAVCSLAAATALFMLVMNSSLPLLDNRRSVKELATTIQSLLRPGDEVMSLYAYYQDLPVYVGRRVTVVSWTGDQFLDGSEDISGWIINDETFWKRWKSSDTLYVVTPKETYEALRRSIGHELYVIAQTDYNMLLTNQESAYLLAAHHGTKRFRSTRVERP